MRGRLSRNLWIALVFCALSCANPIITDMLANKHQQGADYTIALVITGADAEDSITALPDKGGEGTVITLLYTVDNSSFYNQLYLSGVGASIADVTKAGSGTRTYTIDPADATDGVITITAQLVHTDLIPVLITPNPGQSKIYGAADPAFAYTVNDTSVAGSITGAISREPGENAGTYAFTLGTLSAGGDYTLVLSAGAFTISKAAGAAVSGAPTLSGIGAPGSIAVNAVTIPANAGGQTVEYAVSAANNGTGLSPWQAATVFGGHG